MRRWAIALMLAASATHGAEQAGMKQTLTLPHALAPGATAWLEVQVGPLAPGQRVRVTTQDGELIGTIAPFGRAQRESSGIHTLPVPPDTIRADALSVVVTIVEGSDPPRTPTAAEVQSLRLSPSNGTP